MTTVKAYTTELDADHTITVVSVPDYLDTLTPVEYRIADVNVGADTLRVELYTLHDYYNYFELTSIQGVKAYYFAYPEQITPTTVAYVLTRDYWGDVSFTSIHGNVTRSHLLPLLSNYYILPLDRTPRDVVGATPIISGDNYAYFCSVSLFKDNRIEQRGVVVPLTVGENVDGLRAIANMKTISGNEVMSVNAVWLLPLGVLQNLNYNTDARYSDNFSADGTPFRVAVYTNKSRFHRNGTINPITIVNGVPYINTLYVGNFGNMVQVPFEGARELTFIFDLVVDWDAATVYARATIGDVNIDLTPTMSISATVIKRHITDEAAASETILSGISAAVTTVGGIITLNPMAIAGGVMAGAATISNAMSRETARQESLSAGMADFNYRVQKSFYDPHGVFKTELHAGVCGIIEATNSNEEAIDAELDARGFTGVYNLNNYSMGNFGLAINGKNAYGTFLQITDAHVERVGVNPKRADQIESILQRGTTIYADYANVGSKINYKKYLV